MKADIVPFRGPDFSEYKPGDGEKRTLHWNPPGEDEPVAIDVVPMSGVAIVYFPGEQVSLFVGNIQLAMTVVEWEALKPRVEQVIDAGRVNSKAAGIDGTPVKAFEL
jgi:hypothetical protein